MVSVGLVATVPDLPCEPLVEEELFVMLPEDSAIRSR